MRLRQNMTNHILNAFFDHLYSVEEDEAEQKKILDKITNCEIISACGQYNNLINTHHIIAVVQTKGSQQHYCVSMTDRGVNCECSDYQYRKKHKGQFCKHIIFVSLALTGQVERPNIDPI